MRILVYSISTKATRRKAAFQYAAHSLSRGNLKNLMPRFFTFVRSPRADMVRNLINRPDDLISRPDELINRPDDLLNYAPCPLGGSVG